MNNFLPTSRATWSYRVELYDLLCSSAAPWLAFALRDPRFFEGTLINQALIYCCIASFSSLTIVICARVGNIISEYFSPTDGYRILQAAFASASITSLVAFLVTRLDTIPRSLPIIHFSVLGSFLIVGRLVRARWARRDKVNSLKSGSKEENIMVVGANHAAGFYVRMIDRLGLGKHRVLAIVDPNPHLRGRTLAGHPVIGVPEDLPHILHEYKTHGIEIHRFVVAIDRSALSPNAWEFLHANIFTGHVDIDFMAERLGLGRNSGERSGAHIASKALRQESSSLADSFSLQSRYWRLKRISDVIVAGSLLAILSPILAVVALAVRIGIGSPVIFWQRRIGRGGAGVYILKFRTLLAQFDEQGRLRDESERLPPIGTLLRRTRLDELPQLFNILRGEMSLIGPRPLLPIDQPREIGSRLRVLPGITGWAQVNGGNLISPEEKNALDEYYIQNACFLLDLKILAKTVAILFTGDRRHAKDLEESSRGQDRALWSAAPAQHNEGFTG